MSGDGNGILRLMKPNDADDIHEFSEHLDRLADVTQFDEDGEKQAPIVAEGLTHIAESAAAFQDLFARLRADGLTDDQRLDLLWDLGEELRHMDEHIHGMAYFDSQISDEEGEGEPLDS